MKTKTQILCVVFFALFALILMNIKSFPGVLGPAGTAAIDRIEVQTDSGKHTAVTEPEKIREITAALSAARYLRDDLQFPYSGHAYSLVFYHGDEKLGSMVLGGSPEINGGKYIALGSVDTGKIKAAAGISN